MALIRGGGLRTRTESVVKAQGRRAENATVPARQGNQVQVFSNGQPLPDQLVRKTRNMFGKSADTIIDMVEAHNSDGAISLVYRRLLQMTVDLIPLAEQAVIDSRGQKGVYQVNALTSQVREIIADIQAVQDRGMLGRQIVERVLKPAFFDVARHMVESDHRLLNNVLSRIDPKEHEVVRNLFLGAQTEMAKLLKDQMRDVSEQIIKGLT